MEVTHSRKTGRRKPNGFTLFELLVAMAITTTILMASMGLYINALKNTAVNQSQISANASARLAIDYVDKDLKQGIIIPCYTGSPGCNADGTVTISTPASAAGTYTPDGNTLVLQMPAWDNTSSETINGIYDTIIYQYVETQVDGNGGTHLCYNLRRIVSPGAGSDRIEEDRWLMPYDADRDALDPTIRLSEPSVQPISGSTSLFKYYVQQKNAAGEATGQVIERTTEPLKDVVMVETRISVIKIHDDSTIVADASTRSRLRNWIPMN